MIWCADAAGCGCYYNKAWCDFTGRTAQEACQGRWIDSVHPDDRASVLRRAVEGMENETPVEMEYRLRRRDGEYRWVLDRGTPVRSENGELAGYIGFCYDTTERRSADLARREIEEQVRLLGLATRDWVWSWDARSDRVVHNRAFADALGDVPGASETTFQWWIARLDTADRGRVLACYERALNTDAEDIEQEYRVRLRSGATAWVEEHVCLLRDPEGRLVRALGALRDVTKRTEAQEAQARLTRILEATTDFVLIADPQGDVTYLNRAAMGLAGIDGRAIPQDLHLRDLHPAWALAILENEAIPQALNEGVWMGETALIGPDRREVPVSQVIVTQPGSEGKFVATIMRDISERKREELFRIEWANRYDAAIRASGQVLFDWDANTGEITYGGDTMGLLGYTIEELAGGLARFRSLVHADDVEGFDAEFHRIIAYRDPFHLPFRMRQKGGGVVYVDARGYFFLDRTGQFGRMVGFLADVTEQREVQEALRRARDTLEARVAERTASLEHATELLEERARQQEAVARLGQTALSGVELEELYSEAASLLSGMLGVELCCVVDLDPVAGDFIVRGVVGDGLPLGARVGGGLRSLPGYSLHEADPVVSPNLSTETRFTIPAFATERAACSAIAVRIQVGGHPAGAICAFSQDLQEFSSGDISFLRSVGNVLTAARERHRAEENIRAAQAQAELANRAKSEFLSRMSHELRTPLNVIIGFTQLLELEAPTPSQKESISHISRSGRHLLELINEVLDIARLDAAHLPLVFEEVEMDLIIREGLDLVSTMATNRAVSLVYEDHGYRELIVKADRQRLKQVLHNILSNAIKYNREDGTVTVRVRASQDQIRLAVIDTGHGIAPEKIARIFAPFEKMGGDSLKLEGMGVGLMLTQRLVQAMHGEIGVESVLGEGTVVWVDMPRADARPSLDEGVATHEAAIGNASDGAAAKHERIFTLLYVEDQDLNVQLVRRLVSRQSHYQLLTAMRGDEAVRLASEHRPDLILLDLNLPDMSGEDVLQLLHEQDLASIPVVLVTGDVMGERVQNLLQSGASGYLAKPYRLDDFFRAVESGLARHAMK